MARAGRVEGVQSTLLRVDDRPVDDAVEPVAAAASGHLCRRLGHLIGLGVFGVLLVLWLGTAANDVAVLDRDWVAFDNAGWRALGGDWTGVYLSSASERWPYLYPPFTIPLALPLGFLPYYGSYVASIGLVLAGVCAAWRHLAAASVCGAARDKSLVLLSTLLCAPTTLQVLVTGQYSWIYLWALAVVAAHWREPAGRRSGWALAVLAVKPPLALMFLPFLVAQRQVRLLARAAVIVALASAGSLLWGIGPWIGFAQALWGVAARQGGGDAPVEKQSTLLSFAHVVTGGRATLVVHSLWLLVAMATLSMAVRTWRRLGAAPPLRLLGTAVLLAVALTPRLYFYDALVLALPAAGWYLDAPSYARRRTRRLAGCALGSIAVATLVFFTEPAVGTALGPLALLWALVELADLRKTAAAAVEPPAPAEPSTDLALAS